MKKIIFLTGVLFLFVMTGTSFYGLKEKGNPDKTGQDTLRKYTDGEYSGRSQSHYTDEPYWGIVSLSIKNGLIDKATFNIRDSALHEPFDSLYENHFRGNDLYIQQCRNDLNGVRTYPLKLSEANDISKIDVISGATWSYNIFKASVEDALKQDKKGAE